MSQPLILAVDDEDALRELLGQILQLAGFRVICAEDVREAQQLLLGHSPDLVLLDWMLPGLSGIEWAKRLKRDKKFSNLPIIFLTARFDDAYKVQALDAGADDYLTKPFSPKELVARIRAALRRNMKLNAIAALRTAAAAFEAHEAMVITDNELNILQINRAFSESTGYASDELVGRKIGVLKSGRHDRSFYAAMWDKIKSTGSWQGEIWGRRKNGEMYDKWLTITAVNDDNGEVGYYVGTQTDMTERKAAENEIKRLAFYDPLTLLPNRRLLLERLQHGINVGRREGRQLGLLALDLDRFKAVNDSLGHLAGDELLRKVASRLEDRLRETDTVARLGGDEFMVLLENLSHPEDAARVAETIIADLSAPYQLHQGGEVRVGASIGISLYPQHGDSAETLMGNADTALYHAKSEGRGRFAYFSDALTIATRERIALEARLRDALQRDELKLYYQPQIDIPSGRIIGAEALIRWQTSDGELIQPGKFIPIAEESGLIMAIGEWVLQEACRQGRQWLEGGLPPLALAVNVSPYQFRHCDINRLLTTVLQESGFPAGLLELEITESGLMAHQEKALEILSCLRAQGIRLAIDDFGTGYSSLAYLKRFPLDVLKIDKEFIDDIPHKVSDMEIAATIIEMGHTLGFKVLAEGVETQEQLKFLRAKGCDSYQGFFASPPVPPEIFPALLLRSYGQTEHMPSYGGMGI